MVKTGVEGASASNRSLLDLLIEIRFEIHINKCSLFKM